MSDHWTPETPWFDDGKQTQAKWPTYVCRNKNCKSYGKSHPNCRCKPPSFSQQSKSLEYARGGEVHYCSGLHSHQEDCDHYADGGKVEQNTVLEENPGLAVDHTILHHGLINSLTKTGRTKSENQNKISEDHMDAHKYGMNSFSQHSKDLFDHKQQTRIKNQPEEVNKLRSYLEEVRENPHRALEIGGDLGSAFPDHHVELAAKAATAINYFESIKPVSMQAGPLDPVTKPSRVEELQYNRQLAISQNPALVLQHIKDGTIVPDDMKTLLTIYPKLAEEMTKKVTESLIDARSNGTKIPYKQRQGLSVFLNQPLDYTQSSDAAQAIMKSNIPPFQPPQQPGKQSKATNKAVDESNKQAKIEATPLQARQLDRKS